MFKIKLTDGVCQSLVKQDGVQDCPFRLGLEVLNQLVNVVVQVVGVDQHLEQLAHQECPDRGLLVVVLMEKLTMIFKAVTQFSGPPRLSF